MGAAPESQPGVAADAATSTQRGGGGGGGGIGERRRRDEGWKEDERRWRAGRPLATVVFAPATLLALTRN